MTGKEMLKLLKQHGWKLNRTSGSHRIMAKDGFPPLPVPVHGNKDLKKGTENKILKIAGLK